MTISTQDTLLSWGHGGGNGKSQFFSSVSTVIGCQFMSVHFHFGFFMFRMNEEHGKEFHLCLRRGRCQCRAVFDGSEIWITSQSDLHRFAISYVRSSDVMLPCPSYVVLQISFCNKPSPPGRQVLHQCWTRWASQFASNTASEGKAKKGDEQVMGDAVMQQ